MDDDTLRVAQMGIEAESFESSLVGREMVARAEREIAEYTQELVEASPLDTAANTLIRLEITSRRLFQDYLADLVSSGLVAEAQLQEEDETYD